MKEHAYKSLQIKLLLNRVNIELIFYLQPWIYSLIHLELSPICLDQEMTETLCQMTLFSDYYIQILIFFKYKVDQ